MIKILEHLLQRQHKKVNSLLKIGKIVQIPHFIKFVIRGSPGIFAYFKCRPFFQNYIFRCSWAEIVSLFLCSTKLFCCFFLCPKFHLRFFEKSISKAALNSQYSVGMVILCVTSFTVC
jgi:hypothetical protein